MTAAESSPASAARAGNGAPLRVVLATPGRFHTFALGRALLERGELAALVSGFPWVVLKREGLPRGLVKSIPPLTLASHALARSGLKAPRLSGWLDALRFALVDRYAWRWARRADLFLALSGSGLSTGRRVRRQGGVYVCDRGSTHILFQKAILEEEAARFGAPAPVFSRAVIARELAEYEAADAITVPSEFVRRTFIDQGVAPAKVHKIPYGANLELFHPAEAPSANGFDVLFVGGLSLRKGLPYLFEAFRALSHPRKTLTLVGMRTADWPVIERLAPPEARFLGHVPNAELKPIMSRSHVMVLPSVEEGLALVLGEAMASGCPVIATENTGARDLFTPEVEGFITKARDSAAITSALQLLADRPDRRETMARAARRRLESLGGWERYGAEMRALLRRLVDEKATKPWR